MKEYTKSKSGIYVHPTPLPADLLLVGYKDRVKVDEVDPSTISSWYLDIQLAHWDSIGWTWVWEF